jgi:hypothetical protein
MINVGTPFSRRSETWDAIGDPARSGQHRTVHPVTGRSRLRTLGYFQKMSLPV